MLLFLERDDLGLRICMVTRDFEADFVEVKETSWLVVRFFSVEVGFDGDLLCSFW